MKLFFSNRSAAREFRARRPDRYSVKDCKNSPSDRGSRWAVLVK